MVKPDFSRKTLAVFVFSLGLALAGSPAPTRAQDADPEPAAASPSEAAVQLTDWIVASGDNNGVPFVIVDKPSAVVSVYDADGRLLGAEPALLGAALGDDSIPGIGDRKLSAIRPEERATPAGRFLANYGPAKGPGKVLWVDFATAISLHAVVTTNKKEQRLSRLQSPSVEDNRITYGCINVSGKFYEDVVHQVFKDTRGVVYILPDTKPLDEVFPRVQAQASAAPIEHVERAPDAGTSAILRTSNAAGLAR